MTNEEAKIIILEEELIQSYHTIYFLHGCLVDTEDKDPEGHRYDYPIQTLKHLDDIKNIVDIPKGCCHSYINENCESCKKNHERRIKLFSARCVLGIPTNN